MAQEYINIHINNVYDSDKTLESLETACNEAIRFDCKLVLNDGKLYYIWVNKTLGIVQAQFIGSLTDLAKG